jgi:UDP-glucose 4-epimerase
MLLNKKVVLVTGGAGFIGSHLVDRLLETDFDRVVVVDNFFLGNLDNLDAKKANEMKLSIIRMDASDQLAMLSIINKFKVTTVVNLAIVPLPTSLEYPMWTFQENLKITMTLLELLRLGSYQHLIQISSSEIYGSATYTPMDEKHPGNAPTPYAASKYASDVVVQSYIDTFQINATIIRPFNNFGPRQNSRSYAGIIPIVIKKVLENKPVEIFGDGNQTRDFIYVEDTAKGIIDIIFNQSCKGEIINLATGVETTMNSLVSDILEVMNAPDHQIIFKEARPGDVLRHCADISKFVRFFNYKPQAINKTNLEKTIFWYMENLK